MNKLHPGARWQFRVTAYVLLAILSVFLVWVVLPFIVNLLLLFVDAELGLSTLTWAVLLYILLILVLVEIYVRLAYNRWFYEFTQDGLRLERGIIWKRYSNVPYERIQNVDIHRGIIARLFGFSSVLIQTAGYSTHPYAEGYIPALDMQEAERIRTFVMKRITSKRRP